MFSVSTSIYILILLALEAIALPHEQEVFGSADTSASHTKVPGHNHAYFTQVDAEDQLFWIRNLAIYPDPPKLNEHIFVYLDGQIDKQYPGLEISTLKLSGGCPKYGEIEKRIVDISNPVTRHISSDNEGYEYGGPLTLSYNEILFDTFWPWWGYEPVKKNCWLEATARLPDSRILFSIAMNFTAQWPPGGPS